VKERLQPLSEAFIYGSPELWDRVSRHYRRLTPLTEPRKRIRTDEGRVRHELTRTG
jgi:hypothetical protein